MLTLQQLLESDSIASLVTKLNTNFQVISNSNGGPIGIRGPQGIPGLPGRLGPTGPIGPTGATGPFIGIIPFAGMCGGTATVGPTAGMLAPNTQPVEPWPVSSWVWLMWYYGGGVSTVGWPSGLVSAGITAQGIIASHGDVFIDHANNGYWKYLNSVDIQGAEDGVTPYPGGYTAGGYYQTASSTQIYPNLNADPMGWAGSGWYYYPVPDAGFGAGDVWANDYSTYLPSRLAASPPGPSGPYVDGQYPYSATSPLTIANARLLTKYGTVWITTGSDGTLNGNLGDDYPLTSDIGLQWAATPPAVLEMRPGRINAGIDRLLFKFSLDGLPYLNNITARGWSTGTRGATGTFSNAILANATYPENISTTQMVDLSFWVKPQYETTLEKYTPLLFLSERLPEDAEGNYSSIGLYMHTAVGDQFVDAENLHKSLFLWSTRSALDPVEMWPSGATPIVSTDTQNYGEFVMDVRRLITSNQYVCSLPVDMKLSSDGEFAVTPGPISSAMVYDESNIANAQRYRTYQGYISAINGKSLTGIDNAIDYWEYGLGDGTTYGANAGTHDTTSGSSGMYTRRAWYGSSVLDILPSDWEAQSPGDNNYIRVAGMMERGRRFTNGTSTSFLSELILYTSYFNKNNSTLVDSVGVTNDIVDPTANEHNSLPVLYVSPFRNIGIGTFTGLTAAGDEGPLEPASRLHVHVKPIAANFDPTDIYRILAAGTGLEFYLPRTQYSVAAFSGTMESIEHGNSVSDVLFGSLQNKAYEYVNPAVDGGANAGLVNVLQDTLNTSLPTNVLRNAIRSEAWEFSRLNTMHLGAAPYEHYKPIGTSTVSGYKNEFQISLHPLTADHAFADSLADLGNPLKAITGVGIHNLYPRTRTHFYGKNVYNETDHDQEIINPGYTRNSVAGVTLQATYPYYTNTLDTTVGVNKPSANQVVIDYIGDSYTYPLGMYEYQYFALDGATGATGSTGTVSPNAAVYPNRDVISPTRHAVPYGGAFGSNDNAFPNVIPGVPFNDSYRHGGKANAIWEPTSYLGFNLVRDVSAAKDPSSNTLNINGDDKDTTRWFIGTQQSTGFDSGNNGAAAIMFSPHGEMGIVTIPRGFDGGHAYGQWEQRGLGTRDVLNQMKLIVDQHGNLALGNAAGWDLDAYPSTEVNMGSGTLNYVPSGAASLTFGPFTNSNGPGYTYGYWEGTTGQYGRVDYPISPETGTESPASTINKRATIKDYIRFEVGAEKSWSREGRELQKVGYGYPPNQTIVITSASVTNYIKFTTATVPVSWTIKTDNEGRIYDSVITTSGPTISLASEISAIIYPHPTEFNAGIGPLTAIVPAFTAPSGALAAEWWGMSVDTPPGPGNDIFSGYGNTLIPYFTTDLRGSANVRLNNFVYGEGFGIGITGNQKIDPSSEEEGLPEYPGLYTKGLVQAKRQESPKLILTFLEATPTDAAEIRNRGKMSNVPYKKVSTVIQSAQNEASVREYWIPKTASSGGTFMVFTDNMGQKEKNSGFDRTLTSIYGLTDGGVQPVSTIRGLQVYQVVAQEYLHGYTGLTSGANPAGSPGITNAVGVALGAEVDAVNMGYVNYFNKIPSSHSYSNYFASTEYGKRVVVAPYNTFGAINGIIGPDGINAGGSNIGYQGLTGGTAATWSGTVLRNVDKYYEIYAGSTTSYDPLLAPEGYNNHATEIRYKRINTDFTLFDFNITVKVKNPPLSGASIFNDNNEMTANAYIDYKSPRMTQYMSFIYNPDHTFIEDYTEDRYGEGPWFGEWSTYRKWNAGNAVVGEDISADYGTDNTSSPTMPTTVDSPYFMNQRQSATNTVRTWNGNFIDFGARDNEDAADRINSVFGYGPRNPGSNYNPIRPGFGNAVFNAWFSDALTGFYDGSDIDKWGFATRMCDFYSVWHNQTLSRVRNMMWRVTPMRFVNTLVASPPLEQVETLTNNAFLLEVQFDTPIMHCNHSLPRKVFDANNTNGTIKPYELLTVSGQSILRYGLTRTSYGSKGLEP